MDSGKSMIFGVATSDRVRRVYNAVISTGREAHDVGTVNAIVQHGWTEANKKFIERLEMIVHEVIDPVDIVADARQLIRSHMDRWLRR